MFLIGCTANFSQHSLDRVYGENEESSAIYEGTASDLVRSAMEGINGTIFAYGQTSSGKTWTMKGNEEHPGLIPLAVDHLFRYIENARILPQHWH